MDFLHWIAAFLLLIFSITGISTNLFFFLYTVRRSQFRYAFYTFCRTKSVANVIMALSYLVWPCVSCFLGHLYLPSFYNRFIGQFAGFGVYMVGPIVQLMITINRCMATCFPVTFAKSRYGTQFTWCGIALAWAVGTVYFFIGMPDGCAYVFDLESIGWVPQNAPCANDLIWFLLYSVAAIFSASCVFNLAIFIKIMKMTRRISGAAKASIIAKEKKNRALFFQNVMLDSFIFIDMLAVTFAVNWSDAAWYQFVINSMLWLMHINADGAFILFMNVKFGKISMKSFVTRSEQSQAGRRTMGPTSTMGAARGLPTIH